MNKDSSLCTEVLKIQETSNIEGELVVDLGNVHVCEEGELIFTNNWGDGSLNNLTYSYYDGDMGQW